MGYTHCFFGFLALVLLGVEEKINKRRHLSIINMGLGLIVSIITGILIATVLTFEDSLSYSSFYYWNAENWYLVFL